MNRSKLRIAVVDDNADTAHSFALLLRISGFPQVVETSNALAALELVKSERPHVVCLDISMPGIDGYELARRIRQEVRPTPKLVAITGLGTAVDRADAQA